MKNKTIALILLSAMCFAGCASAAEPGTLPVASEKSETVEDTAKEEETPQTTAQEEPAASDTASESEEENPAETVEETAEASEAETQTDNAADGSIPQIVSNNKFFYELDPDNDSAGYLTSGHDFVLMLSEQSSAEYPELSAAMYEYTDGLCRVTEDRIKDEAPEVIEQRKDEYFTEVEYSHERDYYVKRSDPAAVSLMYISYDYTGGAHGYSGAYGVSFDSKTGKELSLSEVLTDSFDLKDFLLTSLKEKYPDTAFIDGYEDIIEEFVNTDGRLIWYFDQDGITFVFNPYELASYADGMLTVHTDYASGSIKEEYVPASDAGCFVGVQLYTDQEIDLNGDNDTETVSIYGNMGEYEYESLVVVIDGEEQKIDNFYCFSFSPFYVRTPGGRSYLYIYYTSDNDYTDYDIYEITGSEIREVDTKNLSFSNASVMVGDEWYRYVPVDTRNLYFNSRFDILSTYWAGKHYHLSENGIPESEDEYYILSSDSFELVSVKDIDCHVPDTDEVITVPAGSTFRLYRTDGDSVVDAYLKDGTLVRLEVVLDEENYTRSIGGVDINELFEQLYYAG